MCFVKFSIVCSVHGKSWMNKPHRIMWATKLKKSGGNQADCIVEFLNYESILQSTIYQPQLRDLLNISSSETRFANFVLPDSLLIITRDCLPTTICLSSFLAAEFWTSIHHKYSELFNTPIISHTL